MFYLGVRQQAWCGDKYELAGAQLRLEMSSGRSLEGSILGDTLVWNHVRSQTGQSLSTLEGGDPWVRLQTDSAPGWPSTPPANTACDARGMPAFVPILTATKTKAYVAAMKSELRNLVAAQEQYRASRARYANTLGDLTFYPSIGVAIEIATATATGWAATATRARARGNSCSIFVGSVRPAGRAPRKANLPVEDSPHACRPYFTRRSSRTARERRL
ncbi:MAG: hypothetical protein HY700_21965 [Gemmatimonadetes bacterium]|nr:hypothetical protein [Gemmatimonadota bacterium]